MSEYFRRGRGVGNSNVARKVEVRYIRIKIPTWGRGYQKRPKNSDIFYGWPLWYTYCQCFYSNKYVVMINIFLLLESFDKFAIIKCWVNQNVLRLVLIQVTFGSIARQFCGLIAQNAVKKAASKETVQVLFCNQWEWSAQHQHQHHSISQNPVKTVVLPVLPTTVLLNVLEWHLLFLSIILLLNQEMN